MSIKEHLIIMIDRLEYYLTKEIEKNIYGTGDTCYLMLFQRMTECIKARREIDYKPYENVVVLLEHHGYDQNFINKFTFKVCCKEKSFADNEIIPLRERLIIIIDILEYYLTKKIEKSLYCCSEYLSVYYDRLVECINARKEIDYVPYESVEMLLEGHGYDKEFISKFLSKRIDK